MYKIIALCFCHPKGRISIHRPSSMHSLVFYGDFVGLRHLDVWRTPSGGFLLNLTCACIHTQSSMEEFCNNSDELFGSITAQ
jgi:hypothetical protein